MQSVFSEKPVPGSPLQKKPDSDNSNNSGITNRSSMSEQLQQHLSLIAAAAEKSSADQSTQLTADQPTQSQSKMTRRITLPVTTDEIQKAERYNYRFVLVNHLVGTLRALRTEQRVQKKDRLYNFICSNQISLNLNTNRVL